MSERVVGEWGTEGVLVCLVADFIIIALWMPLLVLGLWCKRRGGGLEKVETPQGGRGLLNNHVPL